MAAEFVNATCWLPRSGCHPAAAAKTLWIRLVSCSQVRRYAVQLPGACWQVSSKPLRVTLTSKVNASELVAIRQRFKSNCPGTVPSYNDLLVKLVAEILSECPELNACWMDESVYTYHEINIAIAVETENRTCGPRVAERSRFVVGGNRYSIATTCHASPLGQGCATHSSKAARSRSPISACSM